MELIPIMVGISVAIIVAVALFSVFPGLIASFDCPAVSGDTDGNFVEDGAEDWSNNTDSSAVEAWKVSCNSLQTQTTIVPILLSLAIVIAAIVLVTRMFA